MGRLGNGSNNEHSTARVVTLVVVLGALNFLLDLATPPGVICGVLYFLVVLVSLYSGSRRIVFRTAVACTFLVCIGMVLGANFSGAESPGVLGNRFVSIVAIWAVAGLGFHFATQVDQKHQFPTAFLGFAAMSTILAVGVMCWMFLTGRQEMHALGCRMLHITQLNGDITHLDDVLTMSTNMAATTGNIRWEKRYQEHAPRLAEAWAEASELVPAINDEGGRTGVKSVEDGVFVLVRVRQLAQAQSMLAGSRYAKNKSKYQKSNDKLLNHVNQIAGIWVRESEATSRVLMLLTAGVSVMTVVIWLFLLRIFANWNAAERAYGEDLKRQSARLQNTNGRLEDAYNDIQKSQEERLKLESQIQQAQKLESLGVLAGGIAHDFNNLLMGVIGNADLALLQLEDDASGRETVNQIKTAGLHAADLCRQLLAYSGRGRFDIKRFLLTELVDDMVRLLEVSISKTTVLNCEFSDSLPPVEADINQIRQVVMNLVTNASDAIGDKCGAICIATGLVDADEACLRDSFLNDELPAGLYAYVEVTDTGCGMDKETQMSIFDPFFSTKFSGRGLGLAAVLGIVRGHRGAIQVQSEVGKGTTIKVLLPCCDGVASSLVPEFPVDENWKGTGTVLVVDDDQTARFVTVQMLEQTGFDVVSASDGCEGILAFQETPEVLLVLLDMTMPGKDGAATFQELKKLAPQVKVILVSGYNEHDATVRFVGTGLAGFLQKPFVKAELMLKIRNALAFDQHPISETGVDSQIRDDSSSSLPRSLR